ncbi:MAG: DEAD/DEAH box helicase [Planctomycetes bacterium]|nr:DEAD/DEAH box helicase [Planctomycetota bacterium]
MLQVPDGTGAADVLVEVCAPASRGEASGSPRLVPVELSVGALAELPDPLDREILSAWLLPRACRPEWTQVAPPGPNPGLDPVFRVPPAAAAPLLRRLADAGRLATRGTDRRIRKVASFDSGPPWNLVLGLSSADGSARVRLRVQLRRASIERDLDGVEPLAGAGLLVDGETLAELRPAGGLGSALLELARAGIEVPRAECARLLGRLLRLPLDLVPAVDERLGIGVQRPEPQPRLRLHPGAEAAPRGQRPTPRSLRAALAFYYGEHLVTAEAAQPAFVNLAPPALVLRDPLRERAAEERLRELGAEARGRWTYRIPVERLEAMVRHLAGIGWLLEGAGRVVRVPRTPRAAVRWGIDWFDLQLEVDYGEVSVAVQDLIAAFARGETYVRLADGSVGLLPAEWLRRLTPWLQLATSAEGRFRFRPNQGVLLDALLAEAGAELVGSDARFTRWRAALRRFRRVARIRAPADFHAQLRPYQEYALGWFAFLRRFGMGGCLADDMGLGKTVQILALLAQRRSRPEGRVRGAGDEPGDTERRPSLVVAPRSVIFHWRREAERFVPGLRVLEHRGNACSTRLAELRSADLVLITYGTLRRGAASLCALHFDYVILDEAQAIKNPATEAAKAARLLRARHRIVLTGTPIENRLDDLWSLFEFLNPGMLGSVRAFREAMHGARRHGVSKRLRTLLRPFLLRRTKSQVAPELPARTEQVLAVELDEAQRRFYDELRQGVRDSLLTKLDQVGVAAAQIHVLHALLRLRQAACHPGLVEERRKALGSAKLDALLERLRAVRAAGRKALVFSQFTTMLGLLRERLDAAEVTYAYLDGATDDRESCVRRFQDDPACGVFLISLHAGGFGLNLTAAEYVFLLDPWWNPAVEAQAIDRAHRIGQTRAVFACRIIAKDTVEDRILELQERKRALAQAIFAEDRAGMRALTRDDVAALLA